MPEDYLTTKYGTQSIAVIRRLLGAKGGRVKSPAKTAAARANGRLGGRPRIVKVIQTILILAVLSTCAKAAGPCTFFHRHACQHWDRAGRVRRVQHHPFRAGRFRAGRERERGHK